jgi:hypothetical protein
MTLETNAPADALPRGDMGQGNAVAGLPRLTPGDSLHKLDGIFADSLERQLDGGEPPAAKGSRANPLSETRARSDGRKTSSQARNDDPPAPSSRQRQTANSRQQVDNRLADIEDRLADASEPDVDRGEDDEPPAPEPKKNGKTKPAPRQSDSAKKDDGEDEVAKAMKFLGFDDDEDEAGDDSGEEDADPSAAGDESQEAEEEDPARSQERRRNGGRDQAAKIRALRAQHWEKLSDRARSHWNRALKQGEVDDPYVRGYKTAESLAVSQQEIERLRSIEAKHLDEIENLQSKIGKFDFDSTKKQYVEKLSAKYPHMDDEEIDQMADGFAAKDQLAKETENQKEFATSREEIAKNKQRQEQHQQRLAQQYQAYQQHVNSNVESAGLREYAMAYIEEAHGKVGRMLTKPEANTVIERARKAYEQEVVEFIGKTKVESSPSFIEALAQAMEANPKIAKLAIQALVKSKKAVRQPARGRAAEEDFAVDDDSGAGDDFPERPRRAAAAPSRQRSSDTRGGNGASRRSATGTAPKSLQAANKTFDKSMEGVFRKSLGGAAKK